MAAGSRFSTPSIEDAVDVLGRAGVGAGRRAGAHAAVVGRQRGRVRPPGARGGRPPSGATDGGPFPIEVVDHWHDEPELARLLAERVDAALKTLDRDGRP